MRKIVFDIETQNIFQEVGSNNPADLSISVVGYYDSDTDMYNCLLEKDLSIMWPILESADILVTFNGDHFDIPLLDKYYPGDLSKIKSIDLLKEMHKSAGRRMKLDQVAEGTLGIKKSGNGLEALRWWREGKITELKQYCLDDVRITKDLYDFAIKNSKLLFKEGPHVHEVKLDVATWELPSSVSAINHTLPF